MGRIFSGKHNFTTQEVVQKNGSIYVYEVESWYDQGTKNTKRKKRLKGIKNSLTGAVESTRPKRKSREDTQVPIKATMTFNAMLAIAELMSSLSGVSKELQDALPNEPGTIGKILTLSWYSFLNDGVNWTGVENWTRRYLNLLPYNFQPITESIYQDLFKDIGRRTSIKWSIFRQRASKMRDGELLALDSTLYPCGVEDVVDAEVVRQKDGTYKAGYKVLYIYSVTSAQLVAYVKMSGKIPDVSTILYALDQLKALKLNKSEIVVDNGYFSRNNIGELLHAKQHFLMRVKASDKLVKDIVEKNLPTLISGNHPAERIPFAPEYRGICETITEAFPYKRKKGSKAKGLKAGDFEYIDATLKVFVYYSSKQKGLADYEYSKQYTEVEHDLLEGVFMDDAAKKFASKYMEIEEENGEVISVKERKGQRDKDHKYHGLLVLIADKEANISSALKKYRLREKNEEAIKGHKSHSGGDTSKTGGDTFVEGELLVEFLANSLRHSFSTRVKNVESQLGKKNGDINHDTYDNLKVERSLLNLLRKVSFVNVIQSYKTTIIERLDDTDGYHYILKSPSTLMKIMFLQLIGVKIKQAKTT